VSWRESGYVRRSHRRWDPARLLQRYAGRRPPGAPRARPARRGDTSRGRVNLSGTRFSDRRWLDSGAARSRVQSWPLQVAGFWRRSLQARVAATTLLVTGVFVLVVGLFLINQISSGILSAKRHGALVQADAGLSAATKTLSGYGGQASGLLTVADNLASATTGAPGGLYYISVQSTSPVLAQVVSNQPAVPAALRQKVQQGVQALQYARARPPGAARADTALFVGELVSGQAGSFELYYIFPLTAEKQTIALVKRTALAGGVGLMLLIAMITILVTRQVVGPVREVAHTAQRLSAGNLTQRVVVHGEDDLAVLGRSFNDMAASLQRQIRRLEDLSRLQRRFTSDVSHELRTPLTTVRMAAEMLHEQRGELSPALARSTELLHDELDRFEALLGDLLEISRYDAGVARLELDTIDVRAIVATAVAAALPLAEHQGIEVMVSAPSEPALAEVDPRRIERILRNLLGNALDHGEGRPVLVRVATDGTALTISVRDHGVGLRAGEAGLVFNRFWRGDPSRSRLTGGSGLGLAISSEDARLHNGWLQAWGERGRGALFRLTIPVHADRPLADKPVPLDPDAEDLAWYGGGS
jgi:two-component system, OmpR family, sensor histidine kinase MtrB